MKTTKTQRLQGPSGGGMASPRVSDAEQRRRSKRAEMLAAAGFLLEAMGVEPAMAAKLGKLATQARAGEIGGDL